MSALAFPKDPPRVVSKRKAKHLEQMLETQTRIQVRLRDGYKCRVPTCKRSGTHLHHIVYRSKSKVLRWALNNLLYLCPEHHGLVHAKALKIAGTGLKPRFTSQSWMR